MARSSLLCRPIWSVGLDYYVYIKLPIFLGYDYVYWYIGTVLEKELTSCEKLTGFQLVKKFPVFYGTRRFITLFTSARRLSLS